MENSKPHQEYETVGEHVSIFQRGRRWYAHYRLNRKPVRQSLKTSSKKEARRKALGIERDLVNGEMRRPVRPPLITEVIDQYMAHLRAHRRSENTIKKCHFCFKLLLELAEKRGIFAVRRQLIRDNPLVELKLSKPKRTPQPFWQRDQVDRILLAAGKGYKPLFHFLADTGARIGEARLAHLDRCRFHEFDSPHSCEGRMAAENGRRTSDPPKR